MTSTLPPLRDDLQLYEGPSALDGSPTWTLQDPAANRFYRLGQFDFQLLTLWHEGSIEQLIRSFNEQSFDDCDYSDVQNLKQFLTQNNLLQVVTDNDIQRLADARTHAQQNGVKSLLKNYLFFRIPLIHPDNALNRLVKMTEPLYGAVFFWLTLFAALISLLSLSQIWEQFGAQLNYIFTLQGALLYAGAIFLSKVLHEFAHGITAKRYGCRVPTMGVALLVLWPVLYTDVSEAWKLRLKKQRLAVGAAGMLAELALAIYSSLLWLVLPEGILKGAVFILATSTWIITLFVNLNPLLRFDGYFILADLLEMPNLHERAFAFGRWKLRETLFGLGELAPENLPSSRQRFLIIFSWCTWVYRLLLFISIAVLVYLFFFKVLGIFLFLVEIAWFVALPLLREFRHWIEIRKQIRLNWQVCRTLILLSMFVGAMIWPWQSRLSIPAILQASHYANIYASTPGQIVGASVSQGSVVEASQLLVQLSDPELDYQLLQAHLEIEQLRRRTGIQGADSQLLAERLITQQALAEAETRLETLLDREKKSTIRAPFSGKVIETLKDLEVGRWVDQEEPLLKLLDIGHYEIEAFVSEADLHRIQQGVKALFFSDLPNLEPLTATLKSIAPTAVERISHLALQSVHGGPIAVRPTRTGAVPEKSIYQLKLDVHEYPLTYPQQLRGYIWIESEPTSLVADLYTATRRLLLRESGF